VTRTPGPFAPEVRGTRFPPRNAALNQVIAKPKAPLIRMLRMCDKSDTAATAQSCMQAASCCKRSWAGFSHPCLESNSGRLQLARNAAALRDKASDQSLDTIAIFRAPLRAAVGYFLSASECQTARGASHQWPSIIRQAAESSGREFCLSASAIACAPGTRKRRIWCVVSYVARSRKASPTRSLIGPLRE
jgi:hypothetical protein